MAENNSTTDNEFTDVITESSLIPSDLLNSPEFTTITTETIIVSSSSESNESEFDSPENLIKQYDELFDKQEEYNKFIKQKLANFERTIELQFFDLHYNRHRNETHNIRTKRNTAQKLLEEADQLQKDHDQRQKQFLRFIATMTRKNLKHKLYKPIKINNEQAHPRLEQRARRLPNPPVQTPSSRIPNFERFDQNFIDRSTINPQRFDQNVKHKPPTYHPRGGYFRRMSTPRNEYVYKCFKCESTEHLMYHCPQFRCLHCKRLAPGHKANECPQVIPRSINEETGYFDPPAFEDGNLSGEN